ncbi:MAG: hypothetical protein ACJ77K_07515 [Bacteroidia bacterium]
MLRRDYLQKQLEELARVLGKMLDEILKLRTEGKTDEAYALAKESLIEKFELDMENILALSLADFKNLVIESNRSNPVQLSYLADLLYTSATLSKEKGERGQALELFKRSLMIYEYLDKSQRTYSAERHEKINNIKKEL